MKISKSGVIIFLISILIVVLFISTFIGENHQEGMTGRELILVKSILLEKNPSVAISALKDVNVQNDYFSNIINDKSKTDSVKVSELKEIVNELSESSIEGNDMPSSWSQSLIYNKTPAPTTAALTAAPTTAAPTTAAPTINPALVGQICEYSFKKLDETTSNIFNSVSSVYDLSLVNVGVNSSTIYTMQKQSAFPYNLYQNTSSRTNYSYYVNDSNKSINNLTSSFSVSFWCYIDSTVASSFGAIWCLYNESNKNLITFSQQTNGSPIIVITLNNQKFYIGAVAYKKDEYNHLVITCDKTGDTNKISFYVNGNLYDYNGSNFSGNQTSIIWNGSNTITTTGNLFDGKNTSLYVFGGPSSKGITWPSSSTKESHGFNGYISKLSIYDRALKPEDVKYLTSSR